MVLSPGLIGRTSPVKGRLAALVIVRVLGGGALLVRAGYLLSGGFGGGDCEGVVGEVSDEIQASAECLDVAGDGFDGGQLGCTTPSE